MLQGSYAFGILRSDRPDEFVAVRHASPLIVGLGEGENFIASDVTAVLKHTRKIYRLDDGDIVLLSREGVKVFDSELNPSTKGRDHYMGRQGGRKGRIRLLHE